MRSLFGRIVLAAGIALFLAAPGFAQSSGSGGGGKGVCQKKPGTAVFAQFCYDCEFPISVAGSGGEGVPEIHARETVCFCHGWWDPGVTFGMWYPDRIIETSHTAYCSPTMGTTLASSGTALQKYAKNQGGDGGASDGKGQYGGFMNFHEFMYPVGKIIGQLVSTACMSNTSSQADLAYVSEIDPTWDDDSMANVLTPESSLFANPIAQAACIADAAAVAFSQPLEPLFWCLGSWGYTYPMDGIAHNDSVVEQNAADTARAVAMLQRRGLILQTASDAAVCAAFPNPILVKQQYKFEQLYPVPEKSSDHWIGRWSDEWGEWRYRPVVGEDFINLIWQWHDCCLG